MNERTKLALACMAYGTIAAVTIILHNIIINLY